METIVMTANIENFKSASQNIRVISENFVGNYCFCPSCGNALKSAPNNSQALDFLCSNCDEEFELKSKSAKIGNKIVNGAYDSLVSRVQSNNNPNLYLLQYQKGNLLVENLLIVPRYFFTQSLIEKRKPLSPTARRAGWVGCNILISQVPEVGRVYYIKNRKSISQNQIMQDWQATNFLNKNNNLETRGWLLDTLNCVEAIKDDKFSLDQIYAFEPQLRIKHPNNNFIKDKLRQQLQKLRDEGLIEFVERGKYRKVKLNE